MQLLAALLHRKGWRIPAEGLFQYCWFLAAPTATAYRKTLLRRTRIIAVVGSYGKTTAARAVRHVLGIKENYFSRRNSWSFVAGNLLISKPSTKYLAVEVGIDGEGQMVRYARMLRPDTAVVTAVGTEHHRSLKSLENTRAEKAAMVASLPVSGLAILNGDDPNVVWMKERTKARTLLVGLGPHNDLRATDLRLDRLQGTQFSLEFRGTRTPVLTRLIGPHQLNAVLAAAAVGLEEGIPVEVIRERIDAFQPTPGRLQAVHLDNGATLLRDEFKSSYETILTGLATLALIPAQRRIVVIGDVSEPPGGQGRVYRDIGARIAEVADACFIVTSSDNAQRYASGARQAGHLACSFQRGGKFALDAIPALQALILPGDVILIKGRDTQRLDRIALGLLGRKVRCDRIFCDLHTFRCDDCPLL